VAASATAQKELIHYRVDAGQAIIELDDPPANTYSYEMMRRLDEAIMARKTSGMMSWSTRGNFAR